MNELFMGVFLDQSRTSRAVLFWLALSAVAFGNNVIADAQTPIVEIRLCGSGAVIYRSDNRLVVDFPTHLDLKPFSNLGSLGQITEIKAPWCLSTDAFLETTLSIGSIRSLDVAAL